MVKTVSFNEDQYQTWEVLKLHGYTTQDFPSFVKTAFHDRIDEVRNKRGFVNGNDMSHAKIEELAREMLVKTTMEVSKE